jgi:hypothetical protein
MIKFIVKAEKKDMYGQHTELLSLREAKNAWILSEELRVEGWDNAKIKQTNL